MEKFFKLKEKNTSVKTEILAGLTTFLAMAYILGVNPAILGDTGMDKASVFLATALSAGVASIIMPIILSLWLLVWASTLYLPTQSVDKWDSVGQLLYVLYLFLVSFS